jgi:hypothetical protein
VEFEDLMCDGLLAHCDDLIATRGAPKHLRVDNGSEFIAPVVSDFCDELGVILWCTVPGSPRHNGTVESFNGRQRDEMLNGELFEKIAEVQLLLDRWHTSNTTDIALRVFSVISLPRSSWRSLLLNSDGDVERHHNDHMLDRSCGRAL